MKKEWRINHLRALARAYEKEIKSRAPKNLKSCTCILQLYARERRRVDNQGKTSRWRRKLKIRSLKKEVQNILTRDHKKRIKQMIKKNEESDGETDEDDDDQSNEQKDDQSDEQSDDRSNDQNDHDQSSQIQESKNAATPNNDRWEMPQNQSKDQHDEADHVRESMDDFDIYLEKIPSDDNDCEQSMLDAHIQSLENKYLEFVSTGVMQ